MEITESNIPGPEDPSTCASAKNDGGLLSSLACVGPLAPKNIHDLALLLKSTLNQSDCSS